MTIYIYRNQNSERFKSSIINLIYKSIIFDVLLEFIVLFFLFCFDSQYCALKI